jgi:hypothetical protein
LCCPCVTGNHIDVAIDNELVCLQKLPVCQTNDFSAIDLRRDNNLPEFVVSLRLRDAIEAKPVVPVGA